MNANDLSMRDPALAALMGALPGGQNFGSDPLEGADQFGSDFGYSFGMPFQSGPMLPGMAAPAAPVYSAAPNIAAVSGAASPGGVAAHPALIQAWNQQQLQTAHTGAREHLLNPNRYSTTKVERYSFTIAQALTLNTALTFNATLQPNTTIRPQRIVMNAPAPNFVLLSGLFVANVNVFVGTTEDAFTYSAVAQGVVLDLPTLEPANRATVSGNYTGLVPAGYAIGFAFTFTTTLQGPSSIAGSANI